MTSKNIFKGVLTALITPFKEGVVDKGVLENMIEMQIDAAIHALVVGGSTGEGGLLPDDEYYNLIEIAVKCSAGRIPIIAGISSISTRAALEKVLRLNQIGVDGIMSTVPHYVKPEQDGIQMHFEAVASTSKSPVMIYIHPSRTGSEISDETLLNLAKQKNILALKDAGDDIERPLRILPKLMHENFTMLTGDDSKMLAYTANGGDGCVSVLANILPDKCVEIYDLHASYEALVVQREVTPLLNALAAESNPICIKYAASKLNLCRDEESYTLPLTKARAETREAIDLALRELGLPR
ncbi:MAG: 4-hydroxy-tetrahydrodipicolinate synthase [Rickettsiales bacterium]|nr:MAG: 4-hydroxy-tetrahydrodipicolinate synthase [Rickettsiales bacterium]